MYYASHCRPYDQLTDRLWIGRRLSARGALRASASGVTAVVDLTAEFSEPRRFRDLAYLQLPVLDLTAPSDEQINRAVSFIKQHAEAGIVYVHCKVGYSRTAVVAGAYLLAIGDVETVDQAVAKLRQVRPSLIVRPEAMASLQAFQDRLRIPAKKAAVSSAHAKSLS